jgi:nicotinate-nucleotide adenylyltransferase
VSAASASDPSRERPSLPARLGILGGTFNPPHLGHLALARAALAQLGLDAVALVPSHTPPHKPASEDPGAAQRLRMCELAVADQPGLCACALEVARGGASYTVDTLDELHDLRPDIELTLILGSDVARTLPNWRSPARILDLARIAVAARAGEAMCTSELTAVNPRANPTPLQLPPVPISSSLVRERLAHDGEVGELVGSRIADYIARHQLYRGAPVVRVGGGAREAAR